MCSILLYYLRRKSGSGSDIETLGGLIGGELTCFRNRFNLGSESDSLRRTEGVGGEGEESGGNTHYP